MYTGIEQLSKWIVGGKKYQSPVYEAVRSLGFPSIYAEGVSCESLLCGRIAGLLTVT